MRQRKSNEAQRKKFTGKGPMALEADSEREAEWKREKRKKTDKQRVRERKRPSNGRKKKDCSLCRRFRGPWPSEEAADSLYEYGRS